MKGAAINPAPAFGCLLAFVVVLLLSVLTVGGMWLFGVSPAAWMGWLCVGVFVGFVSFLASGAWLKTLEG